MKKEITFKTNWDLVTIKEYFQYIDIVSDTETDEVEKTDKIILLLTNISPLELSQLSIADYKRLRDGVMFVFSEPKPKTIKEYIMVNKSEFECDIKLEKVTAGQYMSLQNIMKIDDYKERIKKSLGVFIRPKDKKWGDYDFDENVEFLFNNLSIVDAITLSTFFFAFQKKLLKYFQTYMKKEKKMEMKKLKKMNQK